MHRLSVNPLPVSWDVVSNPVDLITDTGNWLGSIPHSPRAIVIPVLFATLLFIAYVTLYALTHLPANLPALAQPATAPR